MFDNYTTTKPDTLRSVMSEETAINFVVEMLDWYGILKGLFYDPDADVEEPMLSGEDDLFKYYRELVIRFLPGLGLDLCEEEADAEGLITLEKLMIFFFLASNLSTQNVKYADYTLFDVVLFLSSSKRTRQRMIDTPVINVSGTAGGGQFMDKYCEIVVRQIKEPIRRQQGGLDDILLEKDVGGLSVKSSINTHQRAALLHGKVGKERSHDYVGKQAKGILEEQINKLDPFNRTRAEAVVFEEKVRGSPTDGMTKEFCSRFMVRKRKEWKLKCK